LNSRHNRRWTTRPCGMAGTAVWVVTVATAAMEEMPCSPRRMALTAGMAAMAVPVVSVEPEVMEEPVVSAVTVAPGDTPVLAVMAETAETVAPDNNDGVRFRVMTD
jgi:hypothetical protein